MRISNIQANFAGVPFKDLGPAIGELISEVNGHRGALSQLQEALREYSKITIRDLWGPKFGGEERDPVRLDVVVNYFKGAFFRVNGRALAVDTTLGQLKMIVDDIEEKRRWQQHLGQAVTRQPAPNIVKPAPKASDVKIDSNFDPMNE